VQHRHLERDSAGSRTLTAPSPGAAPRRPGRRSTWGALVLGLGLGAGLLLGTGACYESPAVPPDRPLTCTGGDVRLDCPATASCINGICVRRLCQADNECPTGYICGQGRCAVRLPDGAVSRPDDAEGIIILRPADAGQGD
jgi:hypothetical protein